MRSLNRPIARSVGITKPRTGPRRPPLRWIALEWRGDTTLDDAAQDASAARLEQIGRQLAEAVAAVEEAFLALDSRTPDATRSGRSEALREQSERVRSGT